MKRWIFSCAAALSATFATAASAAQGLPAFDALAEAPPHQTRHFASQQHAQGLLRAGSTVHTEERLGLPTFLWAAPLADGPRRAALKLMRADQAARSHLADYAGLYALSPQGVQAAEVRAVHDTGRGGILVSFVQRVQGVPVFRDELRVLMDRDLSLVSLSGYLSPEAEAAAQAPLDFQLDERDAIVRGVQDLRGVSLGRSAFQTAQSAGGGYLLHPVHAAALADQNLRFIRPPRTQRVLYHLPDRLEPATYVELLIGADDSTDSAGYAYVYSAVDGRLLARYDQVESDAFSYRVWADTAAPYRPYDSPQGDAITPHPTGSPNQVQPEFTAPSLVNLANSPFGHAATDPWLAPGATETSGNNADAYADLNAPDGFSTGDFRANVTAPGVFDRAYDPTKDPQSSVEQQKAAITQLFFNVNFLHDWYYDHGFDEASGNAQKSNYGRGGVEGDPLHAEAQDYGGTNNANMYTPADGSSPRMQMYIFVVPGALTVQIATPASIAETVPGGSAQFGPQSFDITGTLVQPQSVSDLPSDACAPVQNASALAGKIALVDRGNCTFAAKAKNVQTAGAIGMVVVNNVDSPPLLTMAGTDASVTIPSVIVTQAEGNNKLKPNLPAGVSVHLKLVKGVNRDGSLDNQIVAHEWGHYITNRLIGNGAGLISKTARGMGEGWADFHAMLLTVRGEDASASANANYSGTYGVGEYASLFFTNDNFYYGIRRFPYSTDMSKDPLTFKHVGSCNAIPTTAPQNPATAGGDPCDPAFGNSEVHNTGEIWASMLWECYAALLRDTSGRFASFDAVQHRMKDIMVLSYKNTPVIPTFLEARDAILSAAKSFDVRDYQAFVGAFAKRGAGTRAVAPDRYAIDNNPVVESFASGNDVAVLAASVDNSTTNACGNTGVLGAGETGKLNVTVKNVGPGALTAVTATATASGLIFPAGNQLVFGAVQPNATATASIPVSMASGTSGLQSIALQIVVNDPSMASSLTVQLPQRLNQDDVAAQSATEDLESPTAIAAWNITRDASDTDDLSFNEGKWRRVELGLTDHRFFAPDFAGVGADQQLVTPALQVGAGDFSITFKNRYNLSTLVLSGAPANISAGVVEISTDNGNTWADIGSKATANGYSGVATPVGAPLDNRAAFVGQSPNYPAQGTTVLSLGKTYAGKSVLVRFRIVTLGVAAWGWELDDLAFAGLANLPFRKLVGRTGGACNHVPTARASAPATAPENAPVQLDGSASSDPDSLALTYQWIQQSGPPVTLSDPTAQKPTFTPSGLHKSGTSNFSFALLVSNGHVSSAPATATVAVTHVNHAPVANAGGDQSVDAAKTITLDGSASTDADADALTYKWTQTAGGAVTLSDPTAQKPTFTAPGGGAALTFQLVVNDGQADSAPALTHVSVKKTGCGCAANGQPMTAPLIPLALILFALRRRRKTVA